MSGISNGLVMVEDEGSEEFDFEEFKENIEARRRQRRKQVSYEWVETVREAGELYRDTEEVEAVFDELDISDKETNEALTIYRLIFGNPSEKVAAKASLVGQAFFSLNNDVESAVDEEPVEDLLREFVGAVYLEYDIVEEPIGNPVERTMPPTTVAFNKLVGKLNKSFTNSMTSVFAGSGIANLQDRIRENQTKRLANMMQPMIKQQKIMIANLAESIAARQRETMQSMISTSFLPPIQQVQRHPKLLSASIVNSIADIHFPEPVLADLALIQPDFNAAAATATTPTISGTDLSETTEYSTTTVNHKPPETDSTGIQSVNPVSATLDSTLPSPDTITTELVFEIPAMFVQTILSPPEVRARYSNLHKDYQIDLVKALLAIVAFMLTGNATVISIAVLPARTVRQIILSEEDEE